MMCRVRVIGPDGSASEARALLDPALTISLITENLAQSLRLPCHRNATQVSGVGGGPALVLGRGLVQIELKSIGGHEKGRLKVEALVLPKISLELPMQHVQSDLRWNHLKGLINFGRSRLWDNWQGGHAHWSRCLLPNGPVWLAVRSVRILNGHQDTVWMGAVWSNCR